MMDFKIGNLYVGVEQEWTDLLTYSTNNWNTFTFAYLEAEHDRMLGSIRCTFALLGVIVRLSYVYDDQTETRKDINRQMQEIEGGSVELLTTVPYKEYEEFKQWQAGKAL